MAAKDRKEVPSSQELLDDVRAELASEKPPLERFARLLHAVTPTPDRESETMSCQTCRDNLDLIAVDELAGRDISHLYPDLFRHLVSCSTCRAAYFLLRETLRTESQEDTPLMLASPTPELSSPETPWRRVESNSPIPFPLRFEVTRDFISRALHGPQLAAARGGIVSDEVQTTLLLADLFQAGEATYVTEASILRRVDRPDSVDLEVRLTSDQAPPTGLTVHLAWAGIDRRASITGADPVIFRDLPLPELIDPQTGEAKADLLLTFVGD